MGKIMKVNQIENEQPVNLKEIEKLYRRYMFLALYSRTKLKDRALSITYYARAKYYRYLLNESNEACGTGPKMVIKGGKVKVCQLSKPTITFNNLNFSDEEHLIFAKTSMAAS
jgi:hypothetical protein